ncbi:SRPBCC domain-containing protein [Oscillatoria laete-virens NRMC-F 0139]|jgi:uncharacterized protein YndB with AHSA1/START domain|nr:SRPBCC domain-containing protein [Oscillatoria laete-virens]MDL5055419.1 SRPBCC domain-containing protein [Oscillatoria laete-virens NRMC-F 0139]
METIAIERSIWIRASRERVWEALTDPAQVAQWFSPGALFRSTGNGAGARLYVENPETGAEMYVQILEIADRPHRLVLRSQPEPPEPSFITSYTLTEENDGTRLKFLFSGYEALPEEIRQQIMDENAAGFELMLGNIRAFIEGMPLPNPQGF